MAFPRTLTVETPAPTGSFNLTVSMSFTYDELADRGVAPEDVELHVLDTTQGPPPGIWVPAGVNIGESLPTCIVGESGFVVYTDGSVDFWAVREAPGVFAVGAKSTAQDAEPEPGDDSEDNDVTPAPRAVPPVCGLGMIPCTLAGLTTLIVTKRRRRRF